MAEPIDLNVPEDSIRAYLGAAGERLRAARSKTAFGADESEHLLYCGVTDAQGAPRHAVVVLAVRRAKGRMHLVLREVRQPREAEWTEIGANAQPAWSAAEAAEVSELFLAELRKARNELLVKTPVEIFRRGLLGYFNVRGLAGEYWQGPWRIGPPIDPPDATMWGEKVLLCDRVTAAPDVVGASHEFSRQLDELALLLSVFWMHRFHGIRAEHLWFYGPFEPGTDVRSHIAQRGYADHSGTASMPTRGALAVAGAFRDIDRLDSFDLGIPAGEPFTPPSDSPTLFERFYGADAEVADRFLAACKTYDTAHSLWATNTTGALSYLVVTVESLLEVALPRCTTCDQIRGIGRATRDLFFELLPGLEAQRPELERFLASAYSIRSRHFHDAEFVAGEFEPWYQHDILMPSRLQAGETFRRLDALVNGLLVAWLMKKTGAAWDRASAAPPRDRHPKHFAVSVQIGRGASTNSGT